MPTEGVRVVGRERERAVLAAALEAAVSGRGGVVLLTGEGGMGKTTLADELAVAAVARGVQVVRGHGWEGQGSPPLVVWRDVLEVLDGSDPLVGALDGERIRQHLIAAAAQTSLLVVLEDLHAADADSARALAHLSSRLTRTRVLVLATLREHELAERPGAADALAAVSTDCRRVAVPPLTVEGVAALAATLLGAPAPDDLVELVFRRSDGNAFYVRELLEASEGSDVPPGVTVSVQRRVKALPDDVVEVLRLAACAGREVDVRVVAAATDRSVERTLDLLGAAVTAGVLQDRGRGRLRFRHVLVAEVLTSALPPVQRAQDHLRLAAAVRAAAPVHAVTVAHHLLHAGPLAERGEVARWSALAADQAEAAGAPLEAVRHLRLAAEHLDDVYSRTRLHERIGHCLFNAGAHTSEAVRAFEHALAGYEAAGQDRRLGIVHSRLGSHLSLYRHTSDFPRAARHFATAETLLTAPLDRAHLLVGTSTLALLRGRPRTALTDAVEAERIAEQAGRTALAATGRLMRGASLLALGRLGEGFAALDASFSTGPAVRPTVDVQTAWHGIFTGVVLEDRALACSYADRGGRALSGVDLPGQAQILSDLLAPALAMSGDVDRARDSLAHEDLLGFEVQRDGVLPAYAGDWATAVPVMEGMLERDAAAGQGVRVAGLCWALGWVLRLQGELDRARAHLLQASTEADRDGRVLDAVRLRVELALLEVAAGDGRAADVHLAACRPLAGSEDLRGLGLRLELAQVALTGSGFERVIAAADRRRLPFLALDALARWRDAEPERATALTDQLDRRLRVLGLHDTGWGALLRTDVPVSPAAATVRTRLLVLRREGDYWSLTGGTVRVALRDGKGLRHLARLLSTPAREWHVLDLVALAGGAVAAEAGGTRQDLVDAQARRAYRHRLRELEQEAEEAEEAGDDVQAVRARLERQTIVDHLAAATGLGGRTRTWSDPAERARQSVTKTIRTAVDHIAEQDPDLAAHLRGAVRTGTYCSYAPDPSATVRWSVDGV